MIKAIIFDFDGVIHDTFDFSFKINKTIYPDLTFDQYKDFSNGNFYGNRKILEEDIEKFFKIQREEFKYLEIEKEIKKELFLLKEKYELFIISSNSEKSLDIYFENNGIMDVFKEVLGVETHKSKVEKFKMLMEKYGLNKDNCIFVTDTLGDILEANKVDLNTIAVDYGLHDRTRLEKGNPMKIISDFKDLAGEIENVTKK